MSKLFDDASLAMIPSAYKDGRLYSIRPIPEYGPELVTNGTFDTDTDWIKASGSTISGGSLNIVAAPYNANTRQSLSLTNGTTYEIVINAIAAGSATDNTFQLGFADSAGNPSNTTQHEFAVGTSVKKLIATASATDSAIIFRSRDAGTSNLSITNVSVKEVLVADGDFTFSRGSNLAATRVDVNGFIEKGRENLLLQSNQFDTTWDPTSLSLSSNQIGYDGSNNAWLITKPATSYVRLRQDIVSSGILVASVYAKANTLNQAAIYVFGTTNATAKFNLIDGSIITSSNVIDVETTNAGNGWWRLSITFSSTTTQLAIYPDFAEANAGSIYIQDAQLEQGLVATDYIETGTSAAQSGILEDMPRLDYSGGASCPSLLLEPQRSNLITNSEYINESVTSWSRFFATIITNNDSISPDGKNNATKIECPIGESARIDAIALGLAAGTYTYSFYAKGDVSNLDVNIYQDATGDTLSSTAIETLINDSEWSRVDITFTSTASSTIRCIYAALTAGEYFYLWGAQLEQGSYPTSYIPTYGTSQTRSADKADNQSLNPVLGNGNISVMYDFVFDVAGREGSGQIFLLYSNNNSLGIKGTQNTSRRLQLFSYGDFSGYINFNQSSPYSTHHKVLIRVTGEVVELFYNGVKQSGSIDASALGAVYNWSRIKLDSLNSLTADFNQLLTFPTALTDSECIALTS